VCCRAAGCHIYASATQCLYCFHSFSSCQVGGYNSCSGVLQAAAGALASDFAPTCVLLGPASGAAELSTKRGNIFNASGREDTCTALLWSEICMSSLAEVLIKLRCRHAVGADV
jgi:hypothetical protein